MSRGKATLGVLPRNNHEAFTRPMCKVSVRGQRNQARWRGKRRCAEAPKRAESLGLRFMCLTQWRRTDSSQKKKKKSRKESPDILKQEVQAMTQRPNSACSLFFYGPPARKGLYIFNWLKRLSRWTLLDLYKVYEIQFQCPQIKFYLNISMPIHLLVSLHSVIIKRRSVTQIPQPSKKNKYLLYRPLQKKLNTLF